MNHKAHFKGDIQVDGAIVGPDGQAVGGGGSDNRRAGFSVFGPAPIPPNIGTLMSWPEPIDWSDTLFDLTDPTLPVVINPGVYAITATVNVDDGELGKTLFLELDLDYDGQDAFAAVTHSLDPVVSGVSSISTTFSTCWYMPIGAIVTFLARHDKSDDISSWNWNAWVQKLS